MKLYVVGLGPSAGKDMTVYAKQILDSCQCIIGYKNDVNLIEVDYLDKELIKSEADQEVDRCHIALQKAVEGTITAMVCGGDSGIYGMASSIYQISREYPQVEIEVIPGITAATGGGAILGTPLGDDFVVISLCDAATSWQVVEARLNHASDGGFVVCLYNNTPETIRKAIRILSWNRKPETVCGYVKNAGHWGQKMAILSLEDLLNRSEEIDSFTTVYVGNDQTFCEHDKMHTPRGYSAIEAHRINQPN